MKNGLCNLMKICSNQSDVNDLQEGYINWGPSVITLGGEIRFSDPSTKSSAVLRLLSRSSQCFRSPIYKKFFNIFFKFFKSYWCCIPAPTDVQVSLRWSFIFMCVPTSSCSVDSQFGSSLFGSADLGTTKQEPTPHLPLFRGINFTSFSSSS